MRNACRGDRYSVQHETERRVHDVRNARGRSVLQHIVMPRLWGMEMYLFAMSRPWGMEMYLLDCLHIANADEE